MRLIGLVLALVFAPLAAEAQQAERVPRVGFLSFGPAPSASQPVNEAFFEGLRELGYREGDNVVVERRYADLKPERIPVLATELVHLKVDVIVTTGDGEVRAARRATSTIPIVMAVSGDPVRAGYVASLARPGGNVTGLSYLSPEMNPKLLELLKEAVPNLRRVAVIWNGANPVKELDFERAARGLGLEVHSVPIRTASDFDSALAASTRARPDALLTLVDEVMNQAANYTRVVAFAAKHRLPAVAADRRHVANGALMSYAPSLVGMFRRSAVYVDKILKGAKPADLPVEQPTKFELVINLKTAKTLGLTLPQSILLRADQVIE